MECQTKRGQSCPDESLIEIDFRIYSQQILHHPLSPKKRYSHEQLAKMTLDHINTVIGIASNKLTELGRRLFRFLQQTLANIPVIPVDALICFIDIGANALRDVMGLIDLALDLLLDQVEKSLGFLCPAAGSDLLFLLHVLLVLILIIRIY